MAAFEKLFSWIMQATERERERARNQTKVCQQREQETTLRESNEREREWAAKRLTAKNFLKFIEASQHQQRQSSVAETALDATWARHRLPRCACVYECVWNASITRNEPKVPNKPSIVCNRQSPSRYTCNLQLPLATSSVACRQISWWLREYPK